MLRTSLASERITRIDPTTGIKVIQLTSYPTPSMHLDYAWPSVTPDNQCVVFLCQRAASRAAPWDIFRCDTDGLNLYQLTDRAPGGNTGHHHDIPSVTMTLDGRSLYVIWPSENILCTVDVETGSVDELVPLAEFAPQGHLIGGIRISSSGERLFMGVRSYEHGGGHVLRVDLATGAATTFETDASVDACYPNQPRLLITRNFMKLGTTTTADGTRIYANDRDVPMELWSCDENGDDMRYVCPKMFAHATMLGRTGHIQGTGYPPHRCIWVVEEGGGPYKLVSGPYFWHSGASYDGEWIVSDTNWPDVGLQLIHVPTRRFRTLCHAGAAQDHSQFGHAHPALGHDGRIAVFASDRTGVNRVYVARTTDVFRESVVAGGDGTSSL